MFSYQFFTESSQGELDAYPAVGKQYHLLLSLEYHLLVISHSDLIEHKIISLLIAFNESKFIRLSFILFPCYYYGVAH